MHIRQAAATDARHIAVLHAESWRTAYRGLLRDDYLDGPVVADRLQLWEERLQRPSESQSVLVAELDDDVVGFACAYGNHDAAWGTLLDNLHVAPARQRQGIGRELIARVVSWAVLTHPGAGLHLWVLRDNIRAQRFYASLGAEPGGCSVWRSPDGGCVPELRLAWPVLRCNGRQAIHPSQVLLSGRTNGPDFPPLPTPDNSLGFQPDRTSPLKIPHADN